jgi:carboxylesterase
VSEAAAREVDPGAFDFGKGRHAVLCLHGLTGTPYEVRPIGEAMARAGLRAVGPLLPGHGGPSELLAAILHDVWFEAVRNAYRALRAEHDAVSVVGLSLGGLLTLALASEEDVDALVVIGTPLHVHARFVSWVPLLKRWKHAFPKRKGSDIRHDEARERHPSMNVMPLASVHELMRLQRRVRGRLDRVTAPILVAHGALDATAKPSDACEIAGQVASEERELLWLPNSGHVVPVDHDGPALAEAAVDFVTRTRHPLRYVAS